MTRSESPEIAESSRPPNAVMVSAERLDSLRSALGRVVSTAEGWQEASRVRRDDGAVIDAFDEIKMYASIALSESRLMTVREADPGVFERLLTAPGEQFDKDGIVAASVLAHQRGACSHTKKSTYPPGTIGGSPVTVCNDCGVYL